MSMEGHTTGTCNTQLHKPVNNTRRPWLTIVDHKLLQSLLPLTAANTVIVKHGFPDKEGVIGNLHHVPASTSTQSALRANNTCKLSSVDHLRLQQLRLMSHPCTAVLQDLVVPSHPCAPDDVLQSNSLTDGTSYRDAYGSCIS